MMYHSPKHAKTPDIRKVGFSDMCDRRGVDQFRSAPSQATYSHILAHTTFPTMLGNLLRKAIQKAPKQTEYSKLKQTVLTRMLKPKSEIRAILLFDIKM